MKRKENERLLESIEYIDENIVNAVMAKIDPKAPIVNEKIRVRNRALIIAVSIAACLVLLAVAIPTATVVMKLHENVPSDISLVIDSGVHAPPTVGADDTKIEVQTPPEHDGTRGLLYEIREDGKTARFVGFGVCTEETVHIASTYDGLPVVEMTLQAYWDEVRKGDGIHIYGNHDYFQYGNEYVKNLIISDTVEMFDIEIIRKCKNLESIYIGAGIRHNLSWGFSSHEGENINKLEVSPDNEVYMSRDNCIIEKATKTLVRGCKTSVIPADGSVETIGIHAFQGVVGLKNILIPDCIKVIDVNAFSWCRDLESIVLPAGLETIYESVFNSCEKLVSVDLNGLTVIPDRMFRSCFLLSEVKGSENIVEIGEGAFDFCHVLKNFTLGTGLKYIGKYALGGFPYEIKYLGTMAEWRAIEKADLWNGFAGGMYHLEKVVCSDGFVPAPSITQHEYRPSTNN